MIDVAMYAASAVTGHAIHLLKKTHEARQDGDPIGIIQLVRSRPYRTALGVAGTAAALLVMHDTGQITVASAVFAGYAADSGIALLKRWGSRL